MRTSLTFALALLLCAALATTASAAKKPLAPKYYVGSVSGTATDTQPIGGGDKNEVSVSNWTITNLKLKRQIIYRGPRGRVTVTYKIVAGTYSLDYKEIERCSAQYSESLPLRSVLESPEGIALTFKKRGAWRMFGNLQAKIGPTIPRTCDWGGQIVSLPDPFHRPDPITAGFKASLQKPAKQINKTFPYVTQYANYSWTFALKAKG